MFFLCILFTTTKIIKIYTDTVLFGFFLILFDSPTVVGKLHFLVGESISVLSTGMFGSL